MEKGHKRSTSWAYESRLHSSLKSVFSPLFERQRASAGKRSPQNERRDSVFHLIASKQGRIAKVSSCSRVLVPIYRPVTDDEHDDDVDGDLGELDLPPPRRVHRARLVPRPRPRRPEALAQDPRAEPGQPLRRAAAHRLLAHGELVAVLPAGAGVLLEAGEVHLLLAADENRCVLLLNLALRVKLFRAGGSNVVNVLSLIGGAIRRVCSGSELHR